MNRVLLWITTAVLGAAATLITSIGGLLGSVLFLLLATPLIVRGDHRLGVWRRLSRCYEQTALGAQTWLEVACVAYLCGRLRVEPT